MSQTRIETVFTADASAIAKESKRAAQAAKNNLRDVGKGASVMGGEASKFGGTLSKIAGASGPLALIGGAIGGIIAAVRLLGQLASEAFANAVEDSKAILANLKAANQRGQKFTDRSKQATETLKGLAGKRNLSATEQQAAQEAIDHLTQYDGLTGVSVQNGRIVGFDAQQAQARNDALWQERLDKENAARMLKVLEEQKKGITFAKETSQVFTNSLTQRGGFSSGGMVKDTARYQNQILRHNERQAAQLQSIEQQIEALKKI